MTSLRRDQVLQGRGLWILIMCWMCYTPLAFPKAQHAPKEQEIIDVSVARREATNRREMTAAAAYIAKDCLFSTEYGALISKDEYIEHRRKMPATYDQTTNPRQYVVHVYGNTAVLNFLVTDLEQYGTKPLSMSSGAQRHGTSKRVDGC